MLVELVKTTTADGHRLDGAFAAGRSNVVRNIDLDAILFLHGVGGNFYGGNLFEHLAQAFSQLGLATLRVNTRGHDSVSMVWGGTIPLRHGAAYEIVDQCRHDVTAWAKFLTERGCQRIGLLGHSLGAIKSFYTQAHEPHSAIARVIACSAPRLSYSAYMSSDAQPRFFESIATARELVDKGQPEALFQAKFPFPILITAASFIDKYGPEERYNILKFVDQVHCPVLATYGQLEVDSGGIAFAGMPDAVLARRRADQSLHTVTIPGADHVYSKQYEPLTTAIVHWLTSA